MAYVRKKIIATLDMSADFPGLHVTVREPTLRQWREQISPLMVSDNDEPMAWMSIFLDVLDSWDLQNEDGTSVPATAAGLDTMDLYFAETVVRQWMRKAIVFNRTAEHAEKKTETVHMPDGMVDTDDPLPALGLSAMDIQIPEELTNG